MSNCHIAGWGSWGYKYPLCSSTLDYSKRWAQVVLVVTDAYAPVIELVYDSYENSIVGLRRRTKDHHWSFTKDICPDCLKFYTDNFGIAFYEI